jgi:hypothetical protein
MSIQVGVGVMCEQSGRCDVRMSRFILRGVVRLAGVGGLEKKRAMVKGGLAGPAERAALLWFGA